MNIAGKTLLITGAGRGIGRALIDEALSRGALRVYAGTRGPLPHADARVTAVKLDVTSAADIQRAAGAIDALDILVNNAGIALDFGGVTRDTFRQTYETNVIAPYFITQTLLPLLKAGPAGRVVNHSSVMGSMTVIGDPNRIPPDMAVPAYCSSKAALNMLTVTTARALEGTNVKVNSAHPGWVKTDMGSDRAPMEVVDGAKTAVALALLPDDGPTGGFFHLGETLPW